jgi:hypothetical protein
MDQSKRQNDRRWCGGEDDYHGPRVTKVFFMDEVLRWQRQKICTRKSRAACFFGVALWRCPSCHEVILSLFLFFLRGASFFATIKNYMEHTPLLLLYHTYNRKVNPKPLGGHGIPEWDLGSGNYVYFLADNFSGNEIMGIMYLPRAWPYKYYYLGRYDTNR